MYSKNVLMYKNIGNKIKSLAEKAHGCLLLDGTMVYINKDVQIGDMDAILRIANELGYIVDKA